MISLRLSERERIHYLTGLHDGYLGGVRVSKNGDLTIWCAAVNGEEYVIVVPDVSALRLSEFTGGNILFGVVLYEPRMAPQNLYASVSYLDTPQYGDLLVTRFNSFIQNNKGFLLSLEMSDRCQCLALSKSLVSQIQIIPQTVV